MPHKSPEAKKQYNSEYSKRPYVLTKRREANKKWRIGKEGLLKEREAVRRLTKRAQCLIATARTRAHKRGLEFGLDKHVDDIQGRIDAGVCELTGYPFDLSPGRRFNSPSLDRIDCSKGYGYDNVRVVLHLVNQALGEWGEDVLAEVMEHWRSVRGRRKRS